MGLLDRIFRRNDDTKATDARPDAWETHVKNLQSHGLPEPGSAISCLSATQADEQAIYDVSPSFVNMLPWVEFLPGSQTMLLDDGQSVAAF